MLFTAFLLGAHVVKWERILVDAVTLALLGPLRGGVLPLGARRRLAAAGARSPGGVRLSP
jgi:hypothetical protein